MVIPKVKEEGKADAYNPDKLNLLIMQMSHKKGARSELTARMMVKEGVNLTKIADLKGPRSRVRVAGSKHTTLVRLYQPLRPFLKATESRLSN